MEIFDKSFNKLPLKRKSFLVIFGAAFFIIGIISFFLKVTTLVESLLIILIGVIYTNLIKLTYRIEMMEKKWKK